MVTRHPLTREAASRGRRGSRRRRGKAPRWRRGPPRMRTRTPSASQREQRERERPLSAQQRTEIGRAVRGGFHCTTPSSESCRHRKDPHRGSERKVACHRQCFPMPVDSTGGLKIHAATSTHAVARGMVAEGPRRVAARGTSPTSPARTGRAVANCPGPWATMLQVHQCMACPFELNLSFHQRLELRRPKQPSKTPYSPDARPSAGTAFPIVGNHDVCRHRGPPLAALDFRVALIGPLRTVTFAVRLPNSGRLTVDSSSRISKRVD